MNRPIDNFRLADIATFVSGGTPSKHVPGYWGGDTPWVSAKDMKSLHIDSSIDTLSSAGRDVASIIPKETLLILVRGMTLFKKIPIGIASRALAINQDIKGLVANERVLPEFLAYSLLAKQNELLQLVDAAGHGTGRLDIDALKEVLIRVPGIPEQRAIANAISVWDASIRKTEQLIASKERRLHALYQKLFGPESHTRSGWQSYRLADLMSPRKEYASPSDALPLYSLTIEDGVTPKTERYDREFLVKDTDAKQYAVVHPGDIVFNPSNLRWGAIARSNVCQPVVVSPIYEVLSIGDGKANGELLSHVLTCPRQIAYFATKTEGTLIERMAVKLDTFLRSEIYLPKKIAEQSVIAELLDEAAGEIRVHRKYIEALRTQKRGLMQKLLTGQWRLPVTEAISITVHL